VAPARQQAPTATCHRLTPCLTVERHAVLDGLLHPAPATGRRVRQWLRHAATAPTAPQRVETRKQVTFLLGLGGATWARGGRNPTRVTWLAQLGWKTPTQHRQRTEPSRRSPSLVALLHQALGPHTDVAVARYDQGLWDDYGAAQKALQEFRQTRARSTNAKLRMLQEIGPVLLDAALDDTAVRALRFARVPAAALRAAVEDTAQLMRPRQDDALDCFGTRYRTIRQFALAFLQTLPLHGQGPDATGLRALEVMRARDPARPRRPVPPEAPMALVTDAWRPSRREPDGTSSRRYDERCTRWTLRSALRAGHVWGEPSRRSTDPAP
jgi:hypothetical protein